MSCCLSVFVEIPTPLASFSCAEREAGDRAMVLGPNARKTYVSLAELQPVQLPRRCLEECECGRGS